MAALGVHHLAVKVADLTAAEAFYVGVLGLQVLRRWPSANGEQDRSVWLDLGMGAFLALERAEGEGNGKAEGEPGIHLLALRIGREEREGWVARLGREGYEVYQQTEFTIYVRDPEGNRVGLSHWPQRAERTERVEDGGMSED
jgi:glyoxylase I family protein